MIKHLDSGEIFFVYRPELNTTIIFQIQGNKVKEIGMVRGDIEEIENKAVL